MPVITTQKAYRQLKPPDFCYLCGEPLNDGTTLNKDHCPPIKMFGEQDRTDYPLMLPTHLTCNNKWSVRDDQLSVLFDVFQERQKLNNPEHAKKLRIVGVDPRDQNLIAVTDIPLSPLVTRICRFVHALLHHEWLPDQTPNKAFLPLMEVDVDGSRPPSIVEQTIAFANALCTAQKSGTASVLRAYNGKFNYASTWSMTDNGWPICIYALDIYRIADLGIDVINAPTCVVGFYAAKQKPAAAAWCSDTKMNHERHEILYPLLPLSPDHA